MEYPPQKINGHASITGDAGGMGTSSMQRARDGLGFGGGGGRKHVAYSHWGEGTPGAKFSKYLQSYWTQKSTPASEASSGPGGVGGYYRAPGADGAVIIFWELKYEGSRI